MLSVVKRVYGIEGMVEELEAMSSELSKIFGSESDKSTAKSQALAIKAAASYAAVVTTLFNIKSSAAWHETDYCKGEMDLLDYTALPEEMRAAETVGDFLARRTEERIQAKQGWTISGSDAKPS